MGMFHVSPSFALIQTDLRRIPAHLGLHEALAGRHLLLTGGTGFFGRWLLALLEMLNRDGAAIKVSATSRNPTYFLDAYPEYRACSWLNWLPGDIRALRSVPNGPVDLVLHAAADTSAAAHAKPLELFETIVDGASRVFDLALRCGGARVLITGSGAQYGSLLDGIAVTEDYTGACVSNTAASIYGESKRMQETLGGVYAKCHGLPVVMTRCFAFSGPGLPLHGHFAIGNFVRDALWADEIVLNSTGNAVRSYLHAADLAAWLLFLLVRGERGVAYNIGSDQAVTVADLARRVAGRLAPNKSVRILGGSESSERSFYVPNINRAKELGLGVWTSLDESIDSMGHWAIENANNILRQSKGNI